MEKEISIAVVCLVIGFILGGIVGSYSTETKVRQAIECVRKNPQADCSFIVIGVEELIKNIKPM